MRKIFTVIVFTIVMLLIGRNLTFLPRFTLFSSPKSEALTLKKQLQELIGKKKGNYDVYFSDLENEELSFGINEHEVYTAASLNKLPIIAVLYYLAGKGKLTHKSLVLLNHGSHNLISFPLYGTIVQGCQEGKSGDGSKNGHYRNVSAFGVANRLVYIISPQSPMRLRKK